jgi:hypothetical protein
MATRPLPTGITRTATGYRAFIHITPWPGYRNGRLISKRFTRTATYEPTLKDAIQWRDTERADARLRQHNLLLREQAAVMCDGKRLPRRNETTWCYIYFARSGDTVKIGRSVDPAQRLRALQLTHAGELELLAAVAAHVALEGALHKRFAHLRTRPTGEWFRLEPDLVAFIRAIQQGENPVALLFEDALRPEEVPA